MSVHSTAEPTSLRAIKNLQRGHVVDRLAHARPRSRRPLDARLLGGAARDHVGDQGAMHVFQSELFGHVRRQIGQLDPQKAPNDRLALAKLLDRLRAAVSLGMAKLMP